MRRSRKIGNNRFRKRTSYGGLLRASGFIAFWVVILAYCFRIGLQFVVIPEVKNVYDVNFRLTVYAPTQNIAYASESATPTPTPYIPTKRDIIFQEPHADIIVRIWNNESSEGKATDPTGINVKCELKGQSNEFGYDPQDNYCFPTFKDAVVRINDWYNTCLSNHTLSECLELYSGNSKMYINSFLNQ